MAKREANRARRVMMMMMIRIYSRVFSGILEIMFLRRDVRIFFFGFLCTEGDDISGLL